MGTFRQTFIPGAGDPLEQIVEGLDSAQDGARSVVDAVRFGPEAIPLLRALLFERERSGLHQARCRAIDALAALHAFDPLAEFLQLERPIDDAIEKLGEDVVISAAARTLARRRDRATYELLERLARRRPLTGILVGLGSFRRTRSIPIFVGALAEDEVRLTAEAVLRSFGSQARGHLVAAAGAPVRDRCESDLRKRRSALGLLGELRSLANDWPHLKPLMTSNDLETAILAAGLGLKFGSDADRDEAIKALRHLHARADWLRQIQIEQYLYGARRRRAGSKAKRDQARVSDGL
jgi:hypothetical protein